MAKGDRLSRKLSPLGRDDGDPNGAPSDFTDHAAGGGPESDADGHPDADPRDPESAGNEDLRVPGEDQGRKA